MRRLLKRILVILGFSLSCILTFPPFTLTSSLTGQFLMKMGKNYPAAVSMEFGLIGCLGVAEPVTEATAVP